MVSGGGTPTEATGSSKVVAQVVADFPEWLLERRRRAEQALVSEMAKSLDVQVKAFRSRPLGRWPVYVRVAGRALTQKVRENGGRVIVHALIAVGVTADGQREVLGLEVVSGKDGAGCWGSCARWSPAVCPGSGW